MPLTATDLAFLGRPGAVRDGGMALPLSTLTGLVAGYRATGVIPGPASSGTVVSLGATVVVSSGGVIVSSGGATVVSAGSTAVMSGGTMVNGGTVTGGGTAVVSSGGTLVTPGPAAGGGTGTSGGTATPPSPPVQPVKGALPLTTRATGPLTTNLVAVL